MIRALSSLDLETIAENGRRFVKENFMFERAVDQSKELHEDI